MFGNVEDHVVFSTFPSDLLSADNSAFESHLRSRSTEISSAISQLFKRPLSSSPEISELQGRIAHLLAAEKGHIIELEKSSIEKQQLEVRLENASLRYMLAEKKYERAKSATIAKLERQATLGGRSETGGGFGSGADNSGTGQGDNVNGQAETGDDIQEVEMARKEAVAAFVKQKEQLETLEGENEKLTGQITALTTKLSNLSDEDYSRTDLFKHLKSQHEDVIKRINNLEATNVQLREEAEKLQTQRTAYRVQLENESQKAIADREHQLSAAENDLARIRTARDELISDLAMRKVTQNQERASIEQIRELSTAREERVKVLESEVERLGLQPGQSDCLSSQWANADDALTGDVHARYTTLEKQYSMLNTELQSMAKAFKKASAQASQKIGDLAALEDKNSRLSAEKIKADQKYFGAMKAKEARDSEVRTLRAQSNKSSDIVSQLKEAEASTRALVINLEKQLIENKESLSNITTQHRASLQQVTERNITVEGSKAQIEELKKTLATKDNSLSVLSSSQRKAEVEIESLKVRLHETQKSLESWKTKGLGNQSGEYEMLRVSFPRLLKSVFPFHVLIHTYPGLGSLHRLPHQL